MLQEIKETLEKRRGEETSLVLPATKFATRLVPELTYNCKDKCAPCLPSASLRTSFVLVKLFL